MAERLDLNGLARLWRDIQLHLVDVLGNKVDKVDGKGLSTNDYTNEDKSKVASASTVPTDHSSSETTYGSGSSSKYGHVKLSDSITSASNTSNGVAATPAAVKSINDKLESSTYRRYFLNQASSFSCNVDTIVNTFSNGILDFNCEYLGSFSQFSGSLPSEVVGGRIFLKQYIMFTGSTGVSAVCVQYLVNTIMNSSGGGYKTLNSTYVRSIELSINSRTDPSSATTVASSSWEKLELDSIVGVMC